MVSKSNQLGVSDGIGGFKTQNVLPSGLSLLFEKGARPDSNAIENVLLSTLSTGLPCRIAHRATIDDGCLKLLASGLTFDMTGLAPALPAKKPIIRSSYGFDHSGFMDSQIPLPDNDFGSEAVMIAPARHIVAGEGLSPVFRTMMGIIANLVLHLPVRGVAWHPAATVMEPRYFSRMMLNWLSGGIFPALGLSALNAVEGGGWISRGLAYFTGQEMQITGRAGESSESTQQLAIRVMDYVVRHGRITQICKCVVGSDTLQIEPSQVGDLVLVWRGG